MRSMTTITDLAAPSSRMGWRLLSAVGFAQICSWGTLYYAFPQIAIAMSAEFSWAMSEVYGALTLGLLLSAFAAVPIGVAIDKGHGRNVMTFGSVLAGILFFMWSQTQSLTWFYIAFAGIGILQACVLYSAAFAVVVRHYEKSRTRDYITTLTLWGGFASTVFIPAIEWLMAYLTWREVLVVLGGVNIVVCAGIYQFLPQGAPVTTEPESSTPSAKQDQVSTTPIHPGARWALLQPIFWALLICFGLYAAMASSFRFHLYPLLTGYGLTGNDAVFILALLGPAQVAGRALMKIFKVRSIARLGIFVASLFPLSFAVMILFPDDFAVLVIAGVTYGAAAGTMTIVKGIAVPEFLTKSSYGLINGLMNTPITALKAFAPSIAAVSWTITGSYTGLMYGLVGTGIAMMLAFAAAAFISKTKTAST